MNRSLLPLLLIVATVTTAVRAQEGFDIQPFRLYRVNGELFLRGDYRTDTETSASSTTKEKELFFEEGIELNTNSYIFHPNLLDIAATLELGLNQQTIDVNDNSRQSNGTLLGYSVNVLALREKPISFRVFANRNESFVDRSFARRIEFNTQREGIEARYNGTVPMSLLFEHATVTEDNESRLREEDSTRLRYQITDRRDKQWYNELVVEYEDTQETSTFTPSGGGAPTVTSLPDTQLRADYVNRWVIGDQQQYRLDGSLHWLHRTGVFNNDQYRGDQMLTITHSPTLESYYLAGFDIDETDQQQQQGYNGAVGFRKQIYDSLNIRGQVDLNNTDFDTGSEHITGGELALSYVKDTPYGQFSSSAEYRRVHENEQSDTGTRLFQNETHTLTVAGELLNQPGVVLASVNVTLTDNTPLVEGNDYILELEGNRVRIRLGPDVTFADETILVDYAASSARDATFATDFLTWTARMDFERFPASIYVEYRLRDETLLDGDDPGNLDRLKRWLFGTELRLGDLTLTGEHERRTQRLSPGATTWRARASYARRVAQNAVFTAGANYTLTQYDDTSQFSTTNTDDFVETWGAHANAVTLMGKHTLLRVGAMYHDSRGRIADMRIRINGAVEWRYGLMELRVNGYHSIYEQSNSDGVTDYIGFELRRRF